MDDSALSKLLATLKTATGDGLAGGVTMNCCYWGGPITTPVKPLPPVPPWAKRRGRP